MWEPCIWEVSTLSPYSLLASKKAYFPKRSTNCFKLVLTWHSAPSITNESSSWINLTIWLLWRWDFYVYRVVTEVGRTHFHISMYSTVDHFLPKIRQNELDEKRRHFLRERQRGRQRERTVKMKTERGKCLRLQSFLFEIVSLLSDSRVAFMSVLCII